MLTLKKFIGLFIFSLAIVSVKGQDTSKVASVPANIVIKTDTLKADSLKAAKSDTLKLAADTLKLKSDSLNKIAADSVKSLKTDSLKSVAKTDSVKITPIVPNTVAPVASISEPSKIYLKTGWAASLKIGTLGLGGEVVKELTKRFSARIGINYFRYQKNLDISDAKMDVDFKLLTYTLIADWYFLRSMHLSAGVAYNLNNIRLVTEPGTSLKVGNYEVTPDELGSLTTRIASNKFTPYIGLGFGRAISRNGRISFNTDLGILYMGGPKVEEFSSTGLIETEPKGNDENRKQIESNLKSYSIHPVLSFQLSYKFIK